MRRWWNYVRLAHRGWIIARLSPLALITIRRISCTCTMPLKQPTPPYIILLKSLGGNHCHPPGVFYDSVLAALIFYFRLEWYIWNVQVHNLLLRIWREKNRTQAGWQFYKNSKWILRRHIFIKGLIYKQIFLRIELEMTRTLSMGLERKHRVKN